MSALQTGRPKLLSLIGAPPASCGVSCCYALLKLSGLSPSYDDVARLVPVEGTGSNFYTMNHACRQFGLNTEVIAATPAEFDKIRWPAIVHYRPMGAESDTMGHFVIVVGLDDHWIHILDAGYANSTLRIPRGDFFRQWSGHLLLPADARKIPGEWITVLGYLLLVALLVFLLVLSRRIVRAWRGDSTSESIISSPALLFLLLLPCFPYCQRRVLAQMMQHYPYQHRFGKAVASLILQPGRLRRTSQLHRTAKPVLNSP